jgi:hypothetical protein
MGSTLYSKRERYKLIKKEGRRGKRVRPKHKVKNIPF